MTDGLFVAAVGGYLLMMYDSACITRSMGVKDVTAGMSRNAIGCRGLQQRHNWFHQLIFVLNTNLDLVTNYTSIYCARQ